ncbi:MAG: MFS transporter, partial [Proteobacteria bacterium]|nr:MFS transporter [Pseudomonadota bacterium]
MHNRRLWVCVFLFTLTTINYTDRVALSVAAKPVSVAFGLTPVEMGYLFSSFLWMYILCLIPVGLLVDRYGGKAVNAGGIALWSAATVATGLSTGFASMAATRMLMGAGEATSWPASNRIIREWFPASERAFANAVFGAGSAAGPAFGAMAVTTIVGFYGWRAGFYAAGAIGFIWLVLWLAVFNRPERVGWLTQAERSRILAERDGRVVPVEQPATPLPRLLAMRSVWGLFLTQGCMVYGGYMLLTWLPSYLQQAKGLSLMNAGFVSAIPFGAAAIMSIILGRIGDLRLSEEDVHSGKRRGMIAVMLMGPALMLAIPHIDNLWAIVAVLAVAASMGWTASALNFALVTDLVRNPADIGKVTSITVLGGNCFGILGPIVTGYVVQATGGFSATFVVAGVLAVLGAVCTLTLTHRPIEAEGTAAAA